MDFAQTNKLAQLFINLSQMHFVRQLLLMAGLAGSIALGVEMVLWSQSSEYRPLYVGMNASDRGKVTASLEQNGLQYRIDNRSGEITVPVADIHKTRLILARTGLPPKATQGFAILDQKQALGTSNFIERARFNRALQEELVQTIQSMDSISEARVHLSTPKQTSFLRSHQRPSASVMVNLYPGSTLSETQIAGIRHLIAASTAGLDGDRVSIVDQQGNLLSTDSGSQYAAGSAHLRLQRQVEEEYSNRIVQILSPIVGINRVHAQVNADLDLTAVETTQENYDPTTVVRSEQAQQEETNQKIEEGGVPGTRNEGGAEGEAEGAQNMRSKSSTTKNYEIDRTISHIKKTPGSINRISVAVLVDYPEDADADADAEGAEASEALNEQRRTHLEDLVKQTIGFDESRGDKVTVVSTKFHREEINLAEPETNWLEQPLLWSTLRQLGAATVILFLIFGVLRPILKTSISMGNSLPVRPHRLAHAGGAEGQAGEIGGVLTGEDQVTLSGTGNGAQGSGQLVQYEQNLAQARAIVQKDSAQAAQVIQGWVVNE